ncbi:MAG: hypothetical protein HYU56_02385 [Candidatus Aenigmarchaeota archaeon]|nr:hypothetical protein [Candidatus Aenigmarchaeota archaeon]
MVDKAESYFHLAQLLATIAGFFILGATIFYASSGQLLASSMQTSNDVTKSLLSINLSNVDQSILSIVESDIKVANAAKEGSIKKEEIGMRLLIFGVIFIIASLVVWCYGDSKCKHIT